ncbi:hypothetical protein [Modestobacter sp. SSW1-42]|uniref:hypothetical protein n=1 Tax=Modestobacter sp. SSW1-42 TaxID=596372 RepID=UPI0039865EA4
MPDPLMAARSRLANLHRAKGGADPAAVTDAKRELKRLLLERDIKLALAEAPPLTADQRASLAALLVGGSK